MEVFAGYEPFTDISASVQMIKSAKNTYLLRSCGL